jgi:multidrug efflux pump
MNLSQPFVMRPIATSLLAAGFMILGIIAYFGLPVSRLPNIEFPTIRVFASQPGADPAVMAATIAAPLERHLGQIAGITELTSTSSLGSTSIAVQFEIGRNIDSAARDVQAALNAAAIDLPSDLPSLPGFRKANPAAAPVLILALTSDTMRTSALYDIADSVVAQRIAQIDGVADVTVTGAEQPAIRIRVDPGILGSLGLGIEAIRTAIINANALSPVGAIDGDAQEQTLGVTDQITSVNDYRALILRAANGDVVRLGSIAKVEQGTRNSFAAGWFNAKPSVVLLITKQVNSNVIETVDRIRTLLPDLQRLIPKGANISIVNDQTTTIRASINDLRLTLLISTALVMSVVFMFLCGVVPTLAAGVTVPLSLAGSMIAMWLAGFSIDILSLMAIIITVGFVVDDAIVMIENTDRYSRADLSPLDSALASAGQIGFTVLSITLSLIAAFTPLLFMPGVMGRLFQEFSWTMVFAISVSAIVSLTVTPTILASIKFKNKLAKSKTGPWFANKFESVKTAYLKSLALALNRPSIPSLAFLIALGATIALYWQIPKGFFPQDDTGLLIGSTEASPDLSFSAARALQLKINSIVMADPAVAGIASSLGSSGPGGSQSNGRLFVSLKPLNERKVDAQTIIARLRKQLSLIAGMRTYFVPAQDLRIGARQSRSQYQLTLWDPDISELQSWVPRILARTRTIPGLSDVTSDQEKGGLQLNLAIDRDAAARLGVSIADIDSALSDAFSQRQVTIIYGPRNQYRVILEVDPQFSKSPADINRIYVPRPDGAQLPLSTIAHMETTTSPLVVNHQNSFPSVTIAYNLLPGVNLEQAVATLNNAISAMGAPASLHIESAGDAKELSRNSASQPILILTALLTIYIVLGVLYESLIHPLTILSTLPSAGLGALLALWIFNIELSAIAFIGIVLLIGIVKKNGIMLVDFAIEARKKGKDSRTAIYEACEERFRPILMTTLTAMLGALPLVFGNGPGSALRYPLGVTIIGGLAVSQLLTLYTTPALYLLFERWRKN